MVGDAGVLANTMEMIQGNKSRPDGKGLTNCLRDISLGEHDSVLQLASQGEVGSDRGGKCAPGAVSCLLYTSPSPRD